MPPAYPFPTPRIPLIYISPADFSHQGADLPDAEAPVAHYAADATWERVRPPLVELTAEERSGLMAKLEKLGFEMPGLVETQAA